MFRATEKRFLFEKSFNVCDTFSSQELNAFVLECTKGESSAIRYGLVLYKCLPPQYTFIFLFGNHIKMTGLESLFHFVLRSHTFISE